MFTTPTIGSNERKTAFIFLPGAWLSPGIYFAVSDIIQSHGYPCVPLTLPSVNANPPLQNYDLDVAAIRECLKDLIVNEGRDVILVVHSYAGMPGSDACEGLLKSDREKRGEPGGVVRVVYIAALAPAKGWSSSNSGEEFPEWMNIQPDKGIVTVAPEDAKRIMFNDLDEETANMRAKKMLPMSIGVFSSEQKYEVWKHVPTTYVYGTDDASYLSEPVVQAIIGAAREAAKKDGLSLIPFETVERCEGGGHCLMLGKKEWLADVLRRAAGENVGSSYAGHR